LTESNAPTKGTIIFTLPSSSLRLQQLLLLLLLLLFLLLLLLCITIHRQQWPLWIALKFTSLVHILMERRPMLFLAISW